MPKYGKRGGPRRPDKASCGRIELLKGPLRPARRDGQGEEFSLTRIPPHFLMKYFVTDKHGRDKGERKMSTTLIADNDGHLNGSLSILKEGDGCIVLMGNSKKDPSARHPYRLPDGSHGYATHRVVCVFSKMSDNFRTGLHNLVEVEELAENLV